jgi:hypothetical protein
MLGASAGEWLPAPGFDRNWHIDGFPRPGNAMQQDTIMQFTMLLGYWCFLIKNHSQMFV